MAEGTKISSLTQYDGKSLTDSVPFSGGTPFNTYRFTVQELTNQGRTALTGGGTTGLNGVTTAKEDLDQVWHVPLADSLQISPYQLVNYDAPQSLPNIVRPLDFNSSTNPKVFYLLGFKGQNLTLTNVEGDGYIQLPQQPDGLMTPPDSGNIKLFTTPTIDLSWITAAGKTRDFIMAGTSHNCKYQFPDTLGFTHDVVTAVGNNLSNVAGINAYNLAGTDFVVQTISNSSQPYLQFRLNNQTGSTSIVNGSVGSNNYGIAATLGFSSSSSFPLVTLAFSGSTSVASAGVFRVGAMPGGDGSSASIKSTGAATITDLALLHLAAPVVAVSPLTATNTWSLMTNQGIKSGGRVIAPSASIGTFVTNVGPGSTSGGLLYCNTTGTETGIVSTSATSSAVPPYFALIKNNGSTASSSGSLTNAAVGLSTILGNLYWCGADGTSFPKAAAITATVVGSVSTGIVPTKLEFSTANTSGVLTNALTIDSSQVVTFVNTPVFTTSVVQGGAASMTIIAGTGNSRTLAFQTTTNTGVATTALALGADQSATFYGTVSLNTLSTPTVTGLSTLVASGSTLSVTATTTVFSGSAKATNFVVLATPATGNKLVTYNDAATLGTNVTSTYTSFYAAPAIPTGLSLSNMMGFYATISSVGAGAAIATWRGFISAPISFPGQIPPTVMHGYESWVPDGVNCYNFYAIGTAPNYFTGNTTVASTFTVLGTTVTAQATVDRSGLRILPGVDPASPVTGDIWFDGVSLKLRVSGVTKTLQFAA